VVPQELTWLLTLFKTILVRVTLFSGCYFDLVKSLTIYCPFGMQLASLLGDK
jgi:hypothetical protein